MDAGQAEAIIFNELMDLEYELTLLQNAQVSKNNVPISVDEFVAHIPPGKNKYRNGFVTGHTPTKHPIDNGVLLNEDEESITGITPRKNEFHDGVLNKGVP